MYWLRTRACLRNGQPTRTMNVHAYLNVTSTAGVAVLSAADGCARQEGGR